MMMTDDAVETLLEYQQIQIMRDIDNLSGLIQIMVFLQKFKKGNITNFVKDLRMNQQPVYRTIGKLIDLGLVELRVETPSKGSFPSKNYYLTTKGRKLGDNFEKLYETYKSIMK